VLQEIALDPHRPRRQIAAIGRPEPQKGQQEQEGNEAQGGRSSTFDN
jgi:hypothetical protein